MAKIRQGDNPNSRALTPYTDSGQVTAFREGQHQKPAQAGLVHRIMTRFLRFIGRIDPGATTEQGSSAFASPSTASMSMLQQRYERRAVIADCRLMVEDDCRVAKSVSMFAREAVRDGVTIGLNKQGQRGTVGARYGKAQGVIDGLQKLWTPALLTGCAEMLTVEGDLFLQAVVAGDRVVAIKRMPTSSMERLTDDSDEFMDPYRAFAQVDVMTNEEVATFPLALMWHERWAWIPGERYGRSEIRSVRRPKRLLEINEEAQSVRRITRGPKRTLWSVGSKENAGDPAEVKQFKEDNGFVEGRREIWDPANVAVDYFGNGLVTAADVGGDGNVSDIEDIRYSQDVMCAGLPTPKALMSVDAESINRDVLEDQRAEWLKQTKPLSDAMKSCVEWSINLGLLLAGIMPETVDYQAQFSTSSIEKPGEILANVIDAYDTGLLPLEKAVQQIASIFDIDDVDQAVADLKAESQEKLTKMLALPNPVNPEGLAPPFPGGKAAGAGQPAGTKQASNLPGNKKRRAKAA
ncbi:MAG: hypothetical protein M3Y56_02515 [Armatimonadota bacterium]|nr:hypothetical protein [Armatimonadota bacterium]